MEINDKRRHEVAENLRRQLRYMRENDDYEKDVDGTECGNTAYRNIAWAVEPYGNAKKGNYVHIIELLADLIDRPTCRNVYDENEMGSCINGFECSECGNMVEDYEGYRVSGEFNYCSKCGAVVVSDDD